MCVFFLFVSSPQKRTSSTTTTTTTSSDDDDDDDDDDDGKLRVVVVIFFCRRKKVCVVVRDETTTTTTGTTSFFGEEEEEEEEEEDLEKKMGLLSVLLRHPSDVFPLLRVKKMADEAKKLPKDENLAFCYDVLNKVSRSFAIVIQQLDEELRDAVCVVYLVLRALDTIEDDMAIENAEKVPQLLKFHEDIYDPEYKHTTCGEKHYKTLMMEYPKVTSVFLRLKKPYKDVIADITRRMGKGMADFIESEVNTLEDWDIYCHYVAGLVGIGLSDLWAGSKLEEKRFKTEMEDLSNAMGLFLQKTNIVRDYLEDIQEIPRPRMFWPRVVWEKYATSLDDLQYKKNRTNAVHCLNELITNALTHACDSLEYMSRVKTPSIFRFCAIPQVMAIATLAECYDNEKVFEGVVKIRRGLSARIMLSSNDTYQIGNGFKHFLKILKNKVRKEDPNHKETVTLCDLAIEKAQDMIDSSDRGKLEKLRNANNDQPLSIGTKFGLLTLFGGYAVYAFNVEQMRESMGLNPKNGARWVDQMQQFFAVLGIVFVLFLMYSTRRQR